MDIRKSKSWKNAEWQYADLIAGSRIRLFGPPLTAQQVITRLRRILKTCPEFYPAELELACRLLLKGRNKRAERQVLKGLETILGVEERTNVEELIERLIDNLKRLRQFDLCRRLLKRVMERDPGNAAFHDSLAHAEALMGKVEKALRHASRAVELEPANPFYKSNLGWILMVAGKVKEAGSILREALRLDPQNEVTRGNIEFHKHLLAHGGTYLDFLLRPADSAELERLADAEEWEKVDALCASYNKGKLEAMELCQLQEAGIDPALLADRLATLNTFFSFLQGLVLDSYLLYENISFVEDHFQSVMHKFIFKFGDVDRGLIEDIYESLFEYYGFLADRGLVSKRDLAAFRRTSLSLKRGISDRMERYNKVRHNDGMGEEEKDAVRAKLFGEAVFFPHL